jgi:hypothetical protein
MPTKNTPITIRRKLSAFCFLCSERLFSILIPCKSKVCFGSKAASTDFERWDEQVVSSWDG